MNNLFANDSNPRVENAVMRHSRLSRQIPDGAKYENLIKPLYTAYIEKSVLWKKCLEDVDFAGDIIMLQDGQLDDEIRKIHSRAEEFDRKNHTTLTQMLFPNGNITPVVNAPVRKEPDLAVPVALKIESLGQDHELYPLAKELRGYIDACKKAFEEEKKKIEEAGTAEVQMKVAKLNLIRQYGTNYHMAATDHGRAFAEKLFPRLRSSKPKETEENGDDGTIRSE